MAQSGKAYLLGVALLIAVLGVSCTPSGPSAGSTAVSPATQPSVTPAQNTPSPADVQATLTRLTDYDQRLKQMAASSPSPDDLVNTLQEVLTQMDYVTFDYPQMTSQQRSQALAALTGMLGDEVAVVNAEGRVFPVTATAYAIAHPTATPTPGPQTPGPSPAATIAPPPPVPTAAPTVAGTPTGSPIVRQLTADQQAIRNDASNLRTGQPTNQDIVGLLGRLQGDLNQLSQQSTGMSDTDAVAVLKEMDQTVAYIVPVAQAHADRENNLVATATPVPTATPPTTATPPSTSVAPPAANASPAPTKAP